MNTQPLVSVILLNWNQSELTAQCINSLKRCSYPHIEIIVVDQASQDGSVARLTEQFPDIKMIANSENTGFTGGNNQGMRIANGDYFYILNNDTEVSANSLEPLIAALENDPNAGAASPLIRFYFSPMHIQYAGGPSSIDLFRGRNTWRGANTTVPHPYTQIESTTAAHGAAFLIKRSVVEQIGMFDEKLFIYYEEYDWSIRVRKAGYSILFVPEAEIFHKESMTLKKENPFRIRLMARNRLWLSKKYLSPVKYVGALCYVWCVSLPINVFRFIMKRQLKLAHSLIQGTAAGSLG